MFRKLLLAATCLVATPAYADWHEASSEHFVVYADDTAENVKAFTVKLERFDKAVRVALALKERAVGPDARVLMFVLPSVDAIHKLLGTNENFAGFYRDDFPDGPFAFMPKTTISDSIRTQSPQSIMQHEYTHHLMYSNWGDVVFPTWFSEGFAELFATAKIREDGSVTIGAIPAYRAYGIDMPSVFPVEKLIRQGPDYRDGLQTQVFYGRSWLLTHWLMFDRDRSKLLAAYIGAINEGKSSEEAAATLGVTSTVDLKLDGYGKRPSLPSTTLTGAELPIAAVTVRALTAGEAAVMPARMRSHNGVDEKLAKIVLAQARALAAPYPNDAGAQNELAEAEYDAGNYALSEAAADRVLALDAKSVHGLIYKGMAQVAQLEKAKSTDAAAWTTARRFFLAVNKIDPLYSYPIQLYYGSFITAKQPVPKGAHDALLYAYQLSPQLFGLRMEAAEILLRDGRTKAARVALEPIAYSPHAGSFIDLTRKLIAALDKDGAAAALALWDEEKKKPPKAAKSPS